jgi:hypothetical protein
MVVAPLEMQKQLSLADLPADHLAVCAASGLSVVNGSMVVAAKDADMASGADTASTDPEAGIMQQIMDNNKYVFFTFPATPVLTMR